MTDSQIIYLDPSDGIEATIDRLKRLKSPEVALVVPKESPLLQSLTGLKRLAAESRVLQKQVRLVTDDRTGRSLAEQAGLETLASLDPAGSPRLTRVPIDVIRPPAPKPEPKAPTPARSTPYEAPEPVRRPVPSSPAKPGRFRRFGITLPTWLKRGRTPWIAGGVLLLLLLPLFLFVLPSATIHLTPKADPLQLERDVIVDASATEVKVEEASVIIPGKAGERTEEGSTTAAATGKKDVGERARGTVTVKNCEDSSSHNLPAGSTLRSAGLSFTTNNAVTLPAAVVVGGVVTCGEAQVGITAAAAGANYNLSNATFTVPLSGNYSATGSTSGGSTRQVTVVSQGDVDSAKTKLTEELTERAKRELARALGDGVRLPKEALQVSAVSATPSPAVGAEAANFTLQLTLQVKALGFNEEDLRKALVEAAKPELGDDREVMVEEDQEAELEVRSSDLAAGTINMHASLEAFSARRYVPGEVAGAIKGKTVKQAEEYFREEDAISEVKVSIWPSFKSRLPYFASRIKIRLETPKRS
jgi:hypothetical protein